jgi:hypothetical protein
VREKIEKTLKDKVNGASLQTSSHLTSKKQTRRIEGELEYFFSLVDLEKKKTGACLSLKKFFSPNVLGTEVVCFATLTNTAAKKEGSRASKLLSDKRQ